MQISGRRQVKIQVRIADSTSAFEGHIARPPYIATLQHTKNRQLSRTLVDEGKLQLTLVCPRPR